jgi:hypothetical protein
MYRAVVRFSLRKSACENIAGLSSLIPTVSFAAAVDGTAANASAQAVGSRNLANR